MKYYDQMLIDLEKYREGEFYRIKIDVMETQEIVMSLVKTQE